MNPLETVEPRRLVASVVLVLLAALSLTAIGMVQVAVSMGSGEAASWFILNALTLLALFIWAMVAHEQVGSWGVRKIAAWGILALIFRQELADWLAAAAERGHRLRDVVATKQADMADRMTVWTLVRLERVRDAVVSGLATLVLGLLTAFVALLFGGYLTLRFVRKVLRYIRAGLAAVNRAEEAALAACLRGYRRTAAAMVQTGATILWVLLLPMRVVRRVWFACARFAAGVRQDWERRHRTDVAMALVSFVMVPAGVVLLLQGGLLWSFGRYVEAYLWGAGGSFVLACWATFIFMERNHRFHERIRRCYV